MLCLEKIIRSEYNTDENLCENQTASAGPLWVENQSLQAGNSWGFIQAGDQKS